MSAINRPLPPDVDLLTVTSADDPPMSGCYYSSKTLGNYGAACYQAGFDAAIKAVKARIEALENKDKL